MDVGEAEIPSLETVRQLGMIETQQVQKGRMQVVDVDLVFCHIESKIIAFAKGDARLNPPSSQPH